MTWSQFVLDFNKWWSIVTFMSAVLFLSYYTLTAPWWKTPFGRALVAMDFGVGMAVTPGFLFYVFNINIMSDRGTAAVIMVGLTAVPTIIIYRLYTLWAMKHRKFWKNVAEAVKNDRSSQG